MPTSSGSSSLIGWGSSARSEQSRGRNNRRYPDVGITPTMHARDLDGPRSWSAVVPGQSSAAVDRWRTPYGLPEHAVLAR